MINFRIKKNKGFGLVEALVAVSIFAFAIVAPLNAATQSLMASISVKDQMIAMGLARDALEYVHYKRTENSLAGKNWTDGSFTGFFGPFGSSIVLCRNPWGGCKIDTSVSPGVFSLNWNWDPIPLRMNPNTGLYGYNSNWQESKYTRVVRIIGLDSVLNPQRQLSVEVTVSWEFARGVIRSVTLREYVFNWIIEEKI